MYTRILIVDTFPHHPCTLTREHIYTRVIHMYVYIIIPYYIILYDRNGFTRVHAQ